MPKKLTYEYVYNFFKEQGCELIEKEYVNALNKMKYRCECGNISNIRYNDFKHGKRCMKCSGNEKLTFEYVQQYFKSHKCELMEENYKNGSTLMRYKCNCGNISKIRYNNFRQGQRCTKCSGHEKLTFEYVRDYFKEQGCELLEKEYKNNQTKMRYKCECGNIGEICFDNFQNGGRCRICWRERTKQTMLKKYGTPYFSDSGYSKESQKLFNAIYERIDTKYKNKTYYATLNREFAIDYKNKSFKYDYINSEFKKAIEYNGSVWHPLPNLKDTDKGWHIIDKNKTVKEARDYEKLKYEGLEKRGYKILTVWDTEFYRDIESLINKCLKFLTS